jgi:hypothetical protein
MIAVMAVIAMTPVPIVGSIVAIVPIRPIVWIRVIIAVWIIPIIAWKSDPYSDRYSGVGTLNGNKGQQPGYDSD